MSAHGNPLCAIDLPKVGIGGTQAGVKMLLKRFTVLIAIAQRERNG